MLGHLRRGGIRGERCPGTRGESRPDVPGTIHCSRPVVFRAWSIGAFRLGRLARGTKPRLMVPIGMMNQIPT